MRFLLLAFVILAIPAASFAQFGVAITIAPPGLPVYAQPMCPADGYLWTPGYWAYGGEGYFWVPGTWVEAPEVGLLWTPGYWGWGDNAYVWNEGYWGTQCRLLRRRRLRLRLWWSRLSGWILEWRSFLLQPLGEAM